MQTGGAMPESMPTLALGVWLLLLLVGAVVGLILVLGRRRISGKQLLIVSLFLYGLALILFAAANHRSYYTGWVLLISILGAATLVFVRVFRRWLRAESAGTRPATCPPVGLLKEFLAERLP